MSFKTKTAVAAVFAIIAVLISGVVIMRTFRRPDVRPAPVARLVVSTTPTAGWRERFDAVYQLDDGQVLKRVAPPFIPERLDFYRQGHEVGGDPSIPDYLTFQWDGKLQFSGLGYSGGRPQLTTVLRYVLDVPSDAVIAPGGLLRRLVPGDWILRKGASEDEAIFALAQCLNREMHWKIRVAKEAIQRDVVVVRGFVTLKPGLPDAEGGAILAFVEKADAMRKSGGGSSGTGAKFLRGLGDQVNEHFVDETTNLSQVQTHWLWQDSGSLHSTPEGPLKQKSLDRLFEHIAAQTGLSFTREQRTVNVWRVTDGD